MKAITIYNVFTKNVATLYVLDAVYFFLKEFKKKHDHMDFIHEVGELIPENPDNLHSLETLETISDIYCCGSEAVRVILSDVSLLEENLIKKN